MEWQCEIPVGRGRATVNFTGGSTTVYGVTPAEFSTGDPVYQRIIEGSTYFKRGRIKLIRKSGTPDIAKGSKPTQATTPKPVAQQEAQPAEVQEEASGSAEEMAQNDEVPLQEVEVSCLPEAQNYLRDNFGIATSKSRSKEKAQSLANENGIVFVGLE